MIVYRLSLRTRNRRVRFLKVASCDTVSLSSVTVYSSSPGERVLDLRIGWGMRFIFLSCFRHFGPLVAGCCFVFVNSPVTAALPSFYSDQASSQSADQSYEQGVQALRQEQWKSAATSFEQSLKLDPKRADAANGLGVALGKLGDPRVSQAAFRRAIEIDPGFAEAHYNLGLWLRAAGDFDQSVIELKSSIQLRTD